MPEQLLPYCIPHSCPPFRSASHSDSLKSNHVQATHKANNCETSGKSKSESESAQLLQLQERCVFGQRAASSRVSFGFLGNIPNSNPGPVSGFFFVARLVWFLDNAREQKIPFCIPFWDLENCQNHQRCVAPQLSMASWQEIVKCSGAGNKTQIQKEKPHMGNGKKRPDYIARCVWKCNTTNGNTLHVPHAPDTPHTFPADSQMRRRQLAAKGPTESTDLSTPAEKQTGLARGISESVGKATPQPFCNRKRRWRRRRSRRWWEPAQCYSDGPWVMLLVELFTRKDFTRGRGRVSETGK